MVRYFVNRVSDLQSYRIFVVFTVMTAMMTWRVSGKWEWRTSKDGLCFLALYFTRQVTQRYFSIYWSLLISSCWLLTCILPLPHIDWWPETLFQTCPSVCECVRAGVGQRHSSSGSPSTSSFVFYTMWLGSRVVSVLDPGAKGPEFKSEPRRCRVTVLGKLFPPIVPLFTKQRNW